MPLSLSPSNPSWIVRLKSHWLVRYGCALLVTAAIFSFKLELVALVGPAAPFLLASTGIVISAWLGGFGPGLLATLLSAAALDRLFLHLNLLSFHYSLPVLELALFGLEGVVISVLGGLILRGASQLQRQSRLYRHILQAQSDLGEGALLLQDLRIVYANETALRLSGYRREELTTVDQVIDLIIPEQREQIRAQLEMRLRGEPVNNFYETAIINRNGERVDLEVAVQAGQDGKKQNLAILVRDVSRRKQEEELRKKSEEHYRLLVENVRDYAIFTLKKNGSIASWNEGAERILGYEETEVIGHHFSRLFTPEDMVRGAAGDELRRAEREGKATSERWHLRKDGSLFYSSGVVTPLLNERGQLRGFIKVMQDVTARKQTEDKMEHQALHDGLTNLPNRLLFTDRLTQAIATAERNKESLAVMFLDLDQFKNINDTLGHPVGDLILKEVGQRLLRSVRKEDTVARLGGDEFTVLAPQVKDGEAARRLAKKVSHALNPPIKAADRELHVTASIGIALYPTDGEDVQTLLKNADIALYQAKEMGRNTYQLYNASMHTQASERLSLENSLRDALNHGEFVLHYQPITSVRTGQVTSVEALIRWNHPQLGMVLPNQFIPIAEERGLIVALGDWVLRSACRQSQAWKAAGLPEVRVCVNLSARQFNQANLVERICSILTETGMEPRLLGLEVTESFAMHDIELTIKKLGQLKKVGIHLSIDDFGTGHSSLNYLKRLSVDAIKVDKAFIKDCLTDKQDEAIVQAVVSMAHNLKLQVVAEGVEKKEQLQYLANLGCDAVQGYLFSPAVPPDQLAGLIAGQPSQEKPAASMAA